MKPKNEQNRIFGPSGCISEKAFFLYLKNELSEKEKNTFEQHIADCLLCNEALEGYEKYTDDNNIFAELSTIQKELKSSFAIPVKKTLKKSGIKRTLITAVSIAASLLIVITGYYFVNIQTKTIKQDLSLNNPKPEEKTISEKQITTTLPEDVDKETSVEKGLAEEKSVDEKITIIKKNNEQNNFRSAVTITTTGGAITTTGESKDGDLGINGVGLAGKKSEDQQNIYGGIINGDIVFGATQPDRNQLDSLSLKENEQKLAQITDQTVADEITSGKSINLEILEDPKKEADKNFKKVDATGTVAEVTVSRSVNKPSLTTALSFYNSAKYKEAIPELEMLINDGKDDVATLYYLAMAYYNDGQKDAAIPYLDKIIFKKKNNSYYDLALWQKALILTEKNQNKEARQLLNEIVKRGGSLKNNAIQQIDELNKSE